MLVNFVLLLEGVLDLDGLEGFLGQFQVELVEGLLFEVELFLVLKEELADVAVLFL